jgi:predicted nucleotidyltransferase
LFNEIKSIIFKTAGVEGSIRAIINDIDGISRAFIYGSFADGKEKKLSDIDLLIAGKFAEDELIGKIRNLEAKLDREINYVSFTEKEYLKERKKKGSFLNAVLKNKLIVLKGKP